MLQRLAIIGGGPSALFILRALIDQSANGFLVDIFERNRRLGDGFPYSPAGSGPEHVTNVSGNEIPDLPESLLDWLKSKKNPINPEYHITPGHFSDYRVVPRLLFGDYLSDQFDHYLVQAKEKGLSVTLNLHSAVVSITQDELTGRMTVFAADGATADFDKVIICTGHHWPTDNKMPGTNHFESPYPPLKLGSLINMPVRIKGSSLTAVDAMRTIARVNGEFKRDAYGFLSFIPHSAADRFQLQLYSRHGILPGLRFHLEDPHLSRKNLLTKEALKQHRKENDGFVSLDFIFEHNFKNQFRTIDPTFFELIKDWKVEDFAGAALASFSSDDPFTLFEEEYRDAMASIRNKKSEFWKEKLAILSVGMNYPAKYVSAEDKIRFDEFLMPLIAVVIAFIPQQSAEEIIALRKAGRLFMNVSGNEQVDENEAFIDCTGQPRLWINDFPFQDLVSSGSVSQARLRYQFQDKELDVPGLAITDAFRAITIHGNPHPGLYIMAVPYIGGFNPDYSGLDFCEDAAKAIVADLAERDQ